MLQFLHDNAMQVSAFVGTVLTIVIAFTHLTAAQAAAVTGGPIALGNFLAGMVLSSIRKNGKVPQ